VTPLIFDVPKLLPGCCQRRVSIDDRRRAKQTTGHVQKRGIDSQAGYNVVRPVMPLSHSELRYVRRKAASRHAGLDHCRDAVLDPALCVRALHRAIRGTAGSLENPWFVLGSLFYPLPYIALALLAAHGKVKTG
jgi:hypothetical protein